jgi:hypothetical protein
VLSIREKTYAFPQNLRKKDLLAKLFSVKPEFQSILTAAARDFRELSDDDIDLILKQLQELGVLNDLPIAESNG